MVFTMINFDYDVTVQFLKFSFVYQVGWGQPLQLKFSQKDSLPLYNHILKPPLLAQVQPIYN